MAEGEAGIFPLAVFDSHSIGGEDKWGRRTLLKGRTNPKSFFFFTTVNYLLCLNLINHPSLPKSEVLTYTNPVQICSSELHKHIKQEGLETL